MQCEPTRPLRSSCPALPTIPKVKTKHGEAGLRHYAPKAISMMPENIRLAFSLQVFKSDLNNSFVCWSISECYVTFNCYSLMWFCDFYYDCILLNFLSYVFYFYCFVIFIITVFFWIYFVLTVISFQLFICSCEALWVVLCIQGAKIALPCLMYEPETTSF